MHDEQARSDRAAEALAPPDAAGGEPVLVKEHDGVATITLNRPERRNAISWPLVVRLVEVLERLRQDDDVRVVVLTGAGRDFCVGADLDRVGSDDPQAQESRTLRGRSVEDDEERLRHASRAVELLLTSPQPTVAKVNGACAGAGLSLALAADVSVVAEHAMVNTAFVGAGVSGDLGSAWLLTRAVGTTRARSLLLDPGKMTAAQAVALGILTEVTPDVDLRVAQLTAKLVRQAPLAMRHAKQNLLDAVAADLPAYLDAEVPRMVETARDGRAKQAARAFVAGRDTGRDAGRDPERGGSR